MITRSFSHYALISILLILGWITLIFGLHLPILNVKGRIFGIVIRNESTNILNGIYELWQGEKFLIAIVIALFSVLFPAGKMIVTHTLWLQSLNNKISTNFSWLHHLGRWSMLDVFVVAVFIVVAQLNGNLKATAMIGLYIFLAHVLISMLVASKVLGMIGKKNKALNK